MAPILEIQTLFKNYGATEILKDINIAIEPGDFLVLVGPSGCGKSTLLNCIAGLEPITGGNLHIGGKDMTHVSPKDRDIAMVFQSYALYPTMSVAKNITFGMKVRGVDAATQERKLNEVASQLQIEQLLHRRPGQLSGGQRQRIAIARALAVNPEFIICDEPISALDVSIQAQIVNLLEELQSRLGLTYLFIAHDLSMVRHISHRVAVMYLGKMVELTERDRLYDNPQHPYTKALLSAVPIPDPEVEERRSRIIMEGDVPSPLSPPKGCNFNTRCPIAEDRCFEEDPEFRQISEGHWCACHLVQ